MTTGIFATMGLIVTRLPAAGHSKRTIGDFSFTVQQARVPTVESHFEHLSPNSAVIATVTGMIRIVSSR